MATAGAFKEKNKLSVKEPKKYNVVMYNDDFTPMDFVVEMLITVFHKNGVDAVRLMLTVHNNGSAIVGQYSLDIAKTKVKECTDKAKEFGYPFCVKVEG